MKKFILIGLVITVIIVLFNLQESLISPTEKPKFKSLPSPTITQKNTYSIFIPYWTIGKNEIDLQNFDELIYFGLGVNRNGIDVSDLGYSNLKIFINSINASTNRMLAIRMVDSSINFEVLKNKVVQKEIISHSLKIAKENNFKGIVLDLEITSFPFSSITTQINSFVKEFSKEVKKQNLEFAITLSGDTFFKIRPFDVEFLEKQVDRFYIMAYDFSKAKGDPGPNFPFMGKEEYGYDFKTMITDFLNLIPKEKIVVVFGMFGYDWIVDSNEKSLQTAQSISLREVKNSFINMCKYKNCIAKRDEEAVETKVSYTDFSLRSHIVWFEDLESVEKKKEFLKEKGINSVSFWAHSYF